MIDLHIHIIPGLDDGAQSVADALDMAAASVRSGVQTVAATSHGDFSSDNPDILIRNYQRGLIMLKQEIKRAEIPLRVVPGMELLVNDGLLHYAENHPLPSLNGSGYMLVEFYFDITYREAVKRLAVLKDMGYHLVLAHPERYDFIKHDINRAVKLADKGVILQLNKGSLLHQFGERSYLVAKQLLSYGLAGAVASDAHDPVLRTPDLTEVADLLEIEYGMDASDLLLRKWPEEILQVR